MEDQTMFTLGFDVAKDHLDGALTNRSEQLKTRYQVDNTPTAIRALLETIQKKHPKLTIGCEATGPYHVPLLTVCLELGVPVRLLNPLRTKTYARTTIRGRKTDPDDALGIARLILRDEGAVVSPATIAPAKLYVRLATKAIQQKQALQLQRQFLQRLTHTEAAEAFEPALEALDKLSAELRQTAAQLVDEQQCRLLTSITGIGLTLAVSILAEVGDISRFPSSRQLVAYAGLDPRVRQSGTTLNRNTKLTKRGSPELRRSLFLAANVARMYDPELHVCYEARRKRGKSYTESTVAIAQKLCNRIYAVLTRGTPYQKHDMPREST